MASIVLFETVKKRSVEYSLKKAALVLWSLLNRNVCILRWITAANRTHSMKATCSTFNHNTFDYATALTTQLSKSAYSV